MAQLVVKVKAASFTVYLLYFSINFGVENKRSLPKFDGFFFCKIMVKTKPKTAFTENSMFLFVSFLFLGEVFFHFCRLIFYRNLLLMRAHI